MVIQGRRALALVAAVAVGTLGYWGVTRPEAVPVEAIPVSRGAEMPIFFVKTGEPALAMTFDISWGRDTPPKVLDVLKEHNVRATFFLSGPWARRHVDLVRRIVADGHEIASHGGAHVNLSQYPRSEIQQNILRAHQELVAASGVEPRFLRPPNGDYDDLVVATARELGYETVIWALDSIDWKNPGVDFIVRRITRLAKPGYILLFHASDSAKQTHEALPAVITRLREQGFVLLTLGELMKLGEPARTDPR